MSRPVIWPAATAPPAPPSARIVAPAATAVVRLLKSFIVVKPPSRSLRCDGGLGHRRGVHARFAIFHEESLPARLFRNPTGSADRVLHRGTATIHTECSLTRSR